MRVFVLISIAALGLTACGADSELYGVTYVDPPVAVEAETDASTEC